MSAPPELTASCYRRRPLLGRAFARDLFLRILEQVRARYGFVVLGYLAGGPLKPDFGLSGAVFKPKLATCLAD